MHMIAVVLMFGVFANAIQTNPQNFDEFHQAFAAQFEQPAVTAVYNVNE